MTRLRATSAAAYTRPMRTLSIACVAFLFVACQSKPYADVTQPLSFASHGVAFDYPSNWILSETEAGAKKGSALHVVTVRTPSGAFVTIQAFDERMKLEVGAWVERLTKDYQGRFTTESQAFEVGARDVSSRILFGAKRAGLKQRFKVSEGERAAELTAELYVADLESGTATVHVQGTAEDFRLGEAGFALVLDSLKWTRPVPPKEIKTIDVLATPSAEGEGDQGTEAVEKEGEVGSEKKADGDQAGSEKKTDEGQVSAPGATGSKRASGATSGDKAAASPAP